MNMKKMILAVMAVVVTLAFTSCIGDGDDTASYGGAYGYVVSGSSLTYVKTSQGYPITWDGIEDELSTTGQCIVLSYSIDYTTSSNCYVATEHSIDKTLTSYSLSSSDPIDVNDSNFIASLSVSLNYTEVESFYTTWQGNKCFLRYYTSNYGATITPEFYYSLTSDVDSFDVDKDSVIVDVRLAVTGSATSTTSTTDSEYSYCAVDLTKIRTLLKSNDDLDNESANIYFRYYTDSTTYKTEETSMYLYTSE